MCLCKCVHRGTFAVCGSDEASGDFGEPFDGFHGAGELGSGAKKHRHYQASWLTSASMPAVNRRMCTDSAIPTPM